MRRNSVTTASGLKPAVTIVFSDQNFGDMKAVKMTDFHCTKTAI